MEPVVSDSFTALLEQQTPHFTSDSTSSFAAISHVTSLATSVPVKTSPPNVLNRFIWERAVDNDAQPVNPMEQQLQQLIDAKFRLTSSHQIADFLELFQRAKTEPEQAIVLIILRATCHPTHGAKGTANGSGKTSPIGKQCVRAFEKVGGLKLVKKWLETAVECQYLDLLALVLDVLHSLPLQLAAITDARINEPIVKLRKTARQEKVKRAAQDLLKYWRTKFTKNTSSSSPASSSGSTTSSASSSSASSSSTTTSSSSKLHNASVPQTNASSSTVSASSKSGSMGTFSSSGSSTSSVATASASSSIGSKPKSAAALQKKRTIKRLERLPFTGGNGTANGNNSKVTSKSDGNSLLGNLLRRQDVLKSSSTMPKKSSDSQNSTPRTESSSSEPTASDSRVKSTSSSLSSSEKTKQDGSSEPVPSAPEASPLSEEELQKEKEMVMALPTITSFGAASVSGSCSTNRRKIRWADDEGKELVKVKLIESWRDQMPLQTHEASFRDAKLREHADERNAMKVHKELENFHVVPSHEWTIPPLVKLPESLLARRKPVTTEEVTLQSERTRKEMEYMVLDGEVPPPSPKEWQRGNEPHRGNPLLIPLSEPAATAGGMNDSMEVDTAPAPHTTAFDAHDPAMGDDDRDYLADQMSEEDAALMEALGPLKKSTIALLSDHEEILAQVYEEAQLNGNRISDARVIEILAQRSGFGGANASPASASSSFAPTGAVSSHSKYGGGGVLATPGGAMGGGAPSGGSPGYYGYGGAGGHVQQPPPRGAGGVKRKANIMGMGPGAGPAKRFNTSAPMAGNGAPPPMNYGGRYGQQSNGPMAAGGPPHHFNQPPQQQQQQMPYGGAGPGVGMPRGRPGHGHGLMQRPTGMPRGIPSGGGPPNSKLARRFVNSR